MYQPTLPRNIFLHFSRMLVSEMLLGPSEGPESNPRPTNRSSPPAFLDAEASPIRRTPTPRLANVPSPSIAADEGHSTKEQTKPMLSACITDASVLSPSIDDMVGHFLFLSNYRPTSHQRCQLIPAPVSAATISAFDTKINLIRRLRSGRLSTYQLFGRKPTTSPPTNSKEAIVRNFSNYKDLLLRVPRIVDEPRVSVCRQ